MGKKTAVITGASAGLGREFLRAIPTYFPEIEEYWLISRSREKLKDAAKIITGADVKIFPLDLSSKDSYALLEREYDMLKPEIALLINNAGCGFLGNVGEGELERQSAMIELNLGGLTAVTHLTVPYMVRGSKIINISSIASFCPNPRMTVYSATKSFVTAFSLGIGEELKERGITSTAVCPGPMDTDFIVAGGIKGQSKAFDRLPYCSPEKVARGALKAAKKGRSVWTPTFFYKFYRLVAKLVPAKLMMKAAKT